MSDSERQIRDYIKDMETVKLGKWMVRMQNLASRIPSAARAFPLLCVSCAATELLRRYRIRKELDLTNPIWKVN